MRIGEKLISNTVYLFLDWFVLSFFSFIFWMILGKGLRDPSQVGMIATSINFIIFISTFSTLGIIQALNKLIPELKEKKRLKGVYSLIKLSFKPLLVSLLITSIVLLFFSSQFSSFLKIPYYAFLICIISILVVSICDVLGSTLFGLQNMRKLFLTDFIQILIKILFTGFLIFLGFSIFGPLIAFFLGYLFVVFFRFNPNYFTNGKSLSYRKLFFYALPALISTISSDLIMRGQYIILTILQNTEITGIFAIAFTISSVIGALSHAPKLGLFPIISTLSIDKKTKRKQGYLIGLVLRYSLFLIIPPSLVLIIFSRYAVLLFSTPDFLPSTQYFFILIPGAILYGIGTIFSSNLYAIGKPKIRMNIWILSSILFLILSLILTSYFSTLGLSFSYLISMLFHFLLSYIYIKKFVKINIFIGDLLKILLSSLTILLILFIIKPFIHDIFILTLTLFPISLFYLGILLFTNFYRAEDVRILRFFGEKIPIVGKYILNIANYVESRL